ncbi:dihydropyrimidinase [Paraburkholderia lacunae]|uniref:Dihydropyrimidinase n=1 Tax=Paraburkholderia lacunae TaxID=2211104 RepID=A0A370NBL1_9BURK|nr:dihydropyrimidinase [Paraburkholderia lacunae]RDK02986.1 dihydropyrimidinase [Paraburkholderia lacunae]
MTGISQHSFDTVIRNAHIATAADTYTADIGISGGVIVAIGRDLFDGREVIDARGRFVTPGGVDAHVHLDQPTSDGSKMADDFLTGTRSAACGGTTTVIPFALQFKGCSLRTAVEEYHVRAAGKASIDYAFHLIVSDPNEAVLKDELPELIANGYTSIKVYMTYDDMKLDDRQIIDVLACARIHGAMTMIHAENSDCIGWLTERLLAAGLTAPKYHGESRPMMVEREATHRAIALAEVSEAPILIVHVSGREAIEQIHWARGRGLPVFAETCPQYLFLSEDDLSLDGFAGAKCICSPPPRDKANQQAVWTGLQNGLFTIVSSDHAPFNYDDPNGKMLHGANGSFHQVPNGIPGLETRLPLLFSEGVLAGRIDINRFVQLTSTNAAKLYGLYPRKGTIAVGSDADLVIWDTGNARTIRNEELHHAADYTPYEGREVRAWPAITLSRGTVVWADGEFYGRAGHGQFLRCERPAVVISHPKTAVATI